MGDGEERAAEGVRVRHGWRFGVHGGLRGRRELVLAELAAASLGVPGRQVVVRRQAGEEVAHVRVVGRGDQGRVVDVPGFLVPRIEHHLLPGVVRVERCYDTPHRVVAQDRAKATAYVELEAVRPGEKGLELPNRLAL